MAVPHTVHLGRVLSNTVEDLEEWLDVHAYLVRVLRKFQLQVDPLRPLQVPAGDLHELLRRGAVGDVIVSFMGAPLLSDEQRASLGGVKPKVVAFCPGGIFGIQELKALAGQGLLHAAVVSRPAKAGASSATGPGREPFDALYERLDPAALGGAANPGTAR